MANACQRNILRHTPSILLEAGSLRQSLWNRLPKNPSTSIARCNMRSRCGASLVNKKSLCSMRDAVSSALLHGAHQKPARRDAPAALSLGHANIAELFPAALASAGDRIGRATRHRGTQVTRPSAAPARTTGTLHACPPFDAPATGSLPQVRRPFPCGTPPEIPVPCPSGSRCWPAVSGTPAPQIEIPATTADRLGIDARYDHADHTAFSVRKVCACWDGIYQIPSSPRRIASRFPANNRYLGSRKPPPWILLPAVQSPAIVIFVFPLLCSLFAQHGATTA